MGSTEVTLQNEKKQIRSFGLFVAALCAVIVALELWRGHAVSRVAIGIGAYFLVGAFLQPILRPIFQVWMKIAFALGWFNTRLILGILFYVIFSPISMIQRLMGRDQLRLARPKDPSLWTKKPAIAGGNSSYFRQF